jgi:hypothetical protein
MKIDDSSRELRLGEGPKTGRDESGGGTEGQRCPLTCCGLCTLGSQSHDFVSESEDTRWTDF